VSLDVLLGIELKYKEDFDPLLLRMEENKIQYQLLNEKPDLFTFLV
jgi:threonine dehydratase